MPDNQKRELLYDPMPRPDVEVPPLSEPKTQYEYSKTPDVQHEDENVSDLLSNLSFN